MKLTHAPRDFSRFVRTAAKTAWFRRKPVRAGKPHTLPGKLIVSLTSYPPRFPTLDLTLRCLLSQDVKADAVMLWVTHGDRACLPRRVENLQDAGLIIEECDDTRSYKKIVPAFLLHPHAFILICDDDAIYPPHWLERFVTRYRYPDEVLCQWARRLTIACDGRPAPFMTWPQVQDDSPCPAAVPIGCGGVLYPPGTLPAEAADVETFMRLCPKGDDLWLYWMFSRAGKMARCIQPEGRFKFWRGTQDVGLWKQNDFNGGNDRQIAAMLSAYGLPFRDGNVCRHLAR